MLHTFKLFWSPEGRQIATVKAKDRTTAIRKAPQPYRKYLGEIYAVQKIISRHVRIFTVTWWDDGKCIVTSQINGAHVGTWDHGAWYGAHNDGQEIASDVQTLAMECRP